MKKRDYELKRAPTECRSSDARQLGCVFQDMTPPKSILRKGTNMLKPIQRVKFTKAIARHTQIRDRNPSLGYICQAEPHQRSPNAPKFEDRSQRETEWQEQAAREAAWKMAKSVFNSQSKKEQHSSHLRILGVCLHQWIGGCRLVGKEHYRTSLHTLCTDAHAQVLSIFLFVMFIFFLIPV